MPKRLVVVGVVLFLASAVSYQLVYSTEVGPVVFEMAEVTPGIVLKQTATPLAAAPDRYGFVTFLDSISDTTVQFTAGVMLLALGAGLRRHTC